VINSTATQARAAYEEEAVWLPWQKTTILDPKVSPTRFLLPIEKSTTKVAIPDVGDLPVGHSLLHQAALRLSVLQGRGLLQYMSGWTIAIDLQDVIYPAHWHKYGRRGWAVLHALDESGLAEVTLSTVDDDDRYGRYKRVRMAEFLAECETDRLDTYGRFGVI